MKISIALLQGYYSRAFPTVHRTAEKDRF